MDAIEAHAERTLSAVPPYVWDGESLPVPVEEIASSFFGLHVRDVEDMSAAPGCPELEAGQTISGLLLAARGEIWVNAEEARQWPPRRRFTIGHELGHRVLHRNRQEAIFCRSKTVQPEELDGDEPPPPPPPSIEEEASAFAAALLMPARLLWRHYRRDTLAFEELCEMFGASQAAMERRLRALAS